MARKYKTTSATWRLFEASFIHARGKDAQENWLQLKCDSKGQAINLAQGMNACNRQYHQEEGIPLNFSDISARPMEFPVGTGEWIVQLGESYAHRARRNTKLEGMLEKVLEDTQIDQTPVKGPKDTAPTEEEKAQHQYDEDERIKKLMGL